MPNEVVPYCGYARGKMNVNRGSTFFGLGRHVMNMRSGRCDAKMKLLAAFIGKYASDDIATVSSQ